MKQSHIVRALILEHPNLIVLRPNTGAELQLCEDLGKAPQKEAWDRFGERVPLPSKASLSKQFLKVPALRVSHTTWVRTSESSLVCSLERSDS